MAKKKKDRKFLYLIPFISGDRFKIGFTNGRTRLRDLDKIYGIDFDKSVLVFAKTNAIIRSLERQFLAEYEDFIVELKIKEDGWTEIRSIKIFDEIQYEIKEKQNRKPHLALRLRKLTKTFVYPPRKIKPVNPEVKPKKIQPPPYDYQAFTRLCLGGTEAGKHIMEFIKANPEAQSITFHGEINEEPAFLARWALSLDIGRSKKEFYKPFTAMAFSLERKSFEFHFSPRFAHAVLSGEIDAWIRTEGIPEIPIALPPGELDHVDYFTLIKKTSELGIKLRWVNMPWPFNEWTEGTEPYWEHLDKIGYKKVGRNEWVKEPVAA